MVVVVTGADLDPVGSALEENVFRFQVLVGDLVAVQVGQRLEHLEGVEFHRVNTSGRQESESSRGFPSFCLK